MALIINGKRQTGFPWGFVISIVSLIAIAALAWFSGYAKPAKLKAKELAELTILDGMNDAKSYEPISAEPGAFIGNGKDGIWLFEFNFRGKNKIGAMIRARCFMKVDLGRKIAWEVSEREFYGMP